MEHVGMEQVVEGPVLTSATLNKNQSSGAGPLPRVAGLSFADRAVLGQQALSDTSRAGMVTAMIFTSSAIDQLRA
jgi:hypothetical protein